MKRRKTDGHRAEMDARSKRRAERASFAHPGVRPEVERPRPTTTPPHALAAIKAEKIKQDRKRLKRLSDAAATAEGRRWKGP